MLENQKLFTAENKAIKVFSKGYNCAQSIFYAYCSKVGIKEADAERIAAGFGGGIAMNQNICGALTGAIILIGCKYFDNNDVKGSKRRVYKKVNMFLGEFEKLHGSINCKELIGVDFFAKVELQEAREKDLFNKICSRYIESICSLLEKHIPEFKE